MGHHSLHNYSQMRFRCPGVIIRKITHKHATTPEAVPNIVLSTPHSVVKLLGARTTTATTAESLPELLTTVSTSTGTGVEVSLEPSLPDTAMTTTVAAPDISITAVTTTAPAVSVQESSPALPDVVVTTTGPVSEIVLATSGTTTAAPISGFFASSTAMSSFLSFATPSTTGSFSKHHTAKHITAMAPTSSTSVSMSLVSSSTQSKEVGITFTQSSSAVTASKQEKLIAGHLESQVSLVTLNGQPETPTAQENPNPPPEINFRDLFLRLQDSQVQHLVQETQGLLAKGKGKQEKKLQATSLRLLKALNLANVQKESKLGYMIKSQAQAPEKSRL
ncbi:hypothetical protein lerEdw1_018138 [Lerista edwardsae]|nr:hypothetical protein lerEdw1_018138 [Lerista edwardsae]